MTTVRNLFNDLGITKKVLPSFLCDVEILYSREHFSEEDFRNYFISATFKEDVLTIESKVKLFTNFYGRDVKFAAFFPEKKADLHLDIFPLVC